MDLEGGKGWWEKGSKVYDGVEWKEERRVDGLGWR